MPSLKQSNQLDLGILELVERGKSVVIKLQGVINIMHMSALTGGVAQLV